MAIILETLQQRALSYATSRGQQIVTCLGRGCQGAVLITDRQSAFKVLEREGHFQRERDVYRRLRERDVRQVLGFSVPRLIYSDDQRMIVEMTIVQPPYVLDFAGAYLDRRPDYDDEVMQDWEQQRVELFEDDWPRVRQLIYAFERFGIYLTDVKPGNVTVR